MIAGIPSSTLVVAVGFNSLALVMLATAIVLYFKPKLWLPALALFWGLLSGFVDLLSNEPHLPALMLLAGGFFVAFAQPRQAWRWALLIGVWVPAGGLILTALTLNQEPQFNPVALLLPLVLAFAGAYGGALVSRIAGESAAALPRTVGSEEP